MDLSALLQNLRITRSPSPEPVGEVTLERLPNHTKPAYEQLESFPGQDVSPLYIQEHIQANWCPRSSSSISVNFCLKGLGPAPKCARLTNQGVIHVAKRLPLQLVLK